MAAESLRALGSLAPLPTSAVGAASILQGRVSTSPGLLAPAQLSGLATPPSISPSLLSFGGLPALWPWHPPSSFSPRIFSGTHKPQVIRHPDIAAMQANLSPQAIP